MWCLKINIVQVKMSNYLPIHTNPGCVETWHLSNWLDQLLKLFQRAGLRQWRLSWLLTRTLLNEADWSLITWMQDWLGWPSSCKSLPWWNQHRSTTRLRLVACCFNEDVIWTKNNNKKNHISLFKAHFLEYNIFNAASVILLAICLIPVAFKADSM